MREIIAQAPLLIVALEGLAVQAVVFRFRSAVASPACAYATGNDGRCLIPALASPVATAANSLATFIFPIGLPLSYCRKRECPNASPDAFIFFQPGSGVMDTGNYRNRVLNLLAEKLGIPNLKFRILRRTMATRA
jgi:hypothetical protein